MNPKDSLFLVIDIQEKFRKAIDLEPVIKNTVKVLKCFNILKIPVLISEQYPKGLGEVVKEICDEVKKHEYIEKAAFDIFNEKDFLTLLKKINPKHLIIAGIESHVCVLQAAISGMKHDYDVHVLADCIASRKETDRKISLHRMMQEGVKVSSAEMVIFQMMKDCKEQHFKEISSIVKEMESNCSGYF